MRGVLNLKESIPVFCRCALGNHDVITNLRTNWDGFFWLTGEFPPTYDLIVHQVIQIMPRNRGRRHMLSVQNRVRKFEIIEMVSI